MDKLKAAFEQFHEDNPHVFAKLCEIAREVKTAGKHHYGIAAVFERLRWISEFETTGDIYKLNNNHRAFYARMVMTEPDLAGFFHIREQLAS